MDSGLMLEEAQRPPFDPLMPLLPEEVCWILDRSISCEVNDFAGSFSPTDFHHRWSGIPGVLFLRQCIHFSMDMR